MARTVTHRNVCRVFDNSHDLSDGHDIIFVTMELPSGDSLGHVQRATASAVMTTWADQRSRHSHLAR